MTSARTPAPATRPPQSRARVLAVRRLRYFLWSLPVVAALVVAAFWLFGQLVTAQEAVHRFGSGNYAASQEASEALLEPNIIEPWIPHFNRGSALAAQLDYTPAIDDFERALELAPFDRKCMVRINLALSWEMLGDQYLEAGYYQGAVLLYEAAKAVIDAAGDECPPQSPEGEQLESAEERVDGKLEQAQRWRDSAREALGGDAGSGSTEERLEQLDELGRRSEADKSTGEAFERGENDSSGGYTERPW